MQQPLFEILQVILKIQDLDMQMIRLLGLRATRQKELQQLAQVRRESELKVESRQAARLELEKSVRLIEGDVEVLLANQKKLESQQASIKKIDEFNAMMQQVASVKQERDKKERILAELHERKQMIEEQLDEEKKQLQGLIDNSLALIAETKESIDKINEEGRALKAERDAIATQADPELYSMYKRLLRNKRDRVVVPIENRCCTGCHIMLTAQDENMIRKGERIVFCEHCSRIQYWQGTEESAATTTRGRRRRSVAKKA